MKWPARETLCQGRVRGGWCTLLDDHDDKCTQLARTPIVDLGEAARALDRIFGKAGR